MSMQFHHLPAGQPVFDTARARARWAAAKADYLAGGGAPEVCERHGLSLRTFRYRAKKEGWRRADQPAPFIAPDPAVQDDPLGIPDAPEALSGTPEVPAPPLTAAQMLDKCWSHIQVAVAAGRQIEARGWMRLYKDLKPFARFEEIAAREARLEREAADRRAAEATADEAPPGAALVIPDAPSGAMRDEDVAPPLHCFSAPESHEPPPADDDAHDDPAADAAPDPLPARDLARLLAELKAVTARAEQTLNAGTALHSFSPPESHAPGQGP